MFSPVSLNLQLCLPRGMFVILVIGVEVVQKLDFSLSDHLVYTRNSNLCPDIHIFIGKSIKQDFCFTISLRICMAALCALKD